MIDGTATATFATSLFDFGALPYLFFAHPVTATYSDTGGTFTTSGGVETVPPILLDYFFAQIALQLVPLNQFNG